MSLAVTSDRDIRLLRDFLAIRGSGTLDRTAALAYLNERLAALGSVGVGEE